MSKFGKGTLLVVTNNRMNKGSHVYHSIPVGSIVEVIGSDRSPEEILGICYYVWSKKHDVYQYVYEGSLRLFAPSNLSKKLNENELPDF